MKKVITIIAIAITVTSCSSTFNCPAYGGVTEEQVGSMYASQQQENCDDEQGRQNFVFINY